LTIRNPEAFMRALPDWAMIEDCFPGVIRPMDIDGMVEMGGKCLFLEAKGWGVPLKGAQVQAFHTLAKQDNTVIVFWAEGEHVIELAVFRQGEPAVKRPADLDQLRYIVSEWSQERRPSARDS
jgi:hypothetical protein